ncbi:MAG: hypothetical protein HY855_06315 [Burkholderiales bacterium]|nr:hypothetical protein [Burkholderiales bacterium]
MHTALHPACHTALRLLLAGTLAAGSCPLLAAPVACPAVLSEVPSVSPVAPGWTVLAQPGDRPLEQAGVYLGAPEQRGALTPDTVQRDKQHEQLRWQLHRKAGDEFWIGCSYQGTTAMVFRKLESTTTRCQARYALLPTGRRLRLDSLDCD